MASGSVLWTFTGLRLVYIEQEEVDIGGGFSLMRVNDSIRCGWDHYFMTNENYEEAEDCGSYLVFSRANDVLAADELAICSQELQNSLAAFHIIKPTHTLGF